MRILILDGTAFADQATVADPVRTGARAGRLLAA